MCGRTACTLSPQCIRRLCSRTVVKDGQESCVTPEWLDDPAGHKYVALFNFHPTLYSPVLLSGKQPHLSRMGSFQDHKTVIQPMRWGLIPSWYKGTPENFRMKMNNARSDSLLLKNLFKLPLQEGKRCVILCDGYFEWQKTSDGKKLPYFIYFSENSDVYKSLKAEDLENSSGQKSLGDNVKESQHDNPAFVPKKLLTLAGLFNISEPKATGDVVHSYSVITVESHKDYQFIHDRMPAVLCNDKEVDDWLDFDKVPLEQAIELIRPTNRLSYHPVSSMVNNSRQNSPECILLAKHETTKKESPSKSESLMMSWLKRTKNEGDGDDGSKTSPLMKKYKNT